MTKGGASLATVQRLVGAASVDETLPVLFSLSGYTRDAVRWANKAKAPLFQMYPGDLRVTPANPIAMELYPAVS